VFLFYVALEWNGKPYVIINVFIFRQSWSSTLFQGGSGDKITSEQQPREKVAKLIPDQIQTADKETSVTTSIPTNSVSSVGIKLENFQSDLAANET